MTVIFRQSTVDISNMVLSKRKRSASFDSAEILVSLNKRPRSPTLIKKSVVFDMSQNTTGVTDGIVIESDEDLLGVVGVDYYLEINNVLDKSSLWFSADELYEIRLREAEVVKSHRLNQYYTEQIAVVLSEAVRSIRKKTASTTASTSAASSLPLFKDSAEFLANSPARGLECQVVPCMRQRRHQVRTTFLKSQASLRRWTAPNDDATSSAITKRITPALQQQALSEHYQQLSRPSQRVAQLLGEGDARMAKQLLTVSA